MEGFYYYRQQVDPEFESLLERINPPRVCIDNDACEHCTVVKVDSANKDGILLEMVQILTDLDLVISKSYISSDGGWFMDVFHVTDQWGNKIIDETLIHYIDQALTATRKNTKLSRRNRDTDHTALEMTVTDQPGLLSEVSAILADLGCHISSAVAWTHNNRAACIIYVDNHRPTADAPILTQVQEQLQNVMVAHHRKGDRWSLRLESPVTGQTHMERRLHQLMTADDSSRESGDGCGACEVTIESCEERGYSLVNVRCRDRPKLLFDTVCALTDLHCVVFHAAISSSRSVAVQEYYIRHKDGCILDTDTEKQRLTQCLIAAIQRRASHGVRIDVTAKDRLGLLSEVTRAFREQALSVSRAEINTKGDVATGTFYLTDASGHKIPKEALDAIKREIDGTVKVIDEAPGFLSPSSPSITKKNYSKDDRSKIVSLGSLLWSRLGRLILAP